MLNHYCAITRVDYKEFRQCLEKEQSALRSTASSSRQHGNVKILIIMSMMLTTTAAYIGGICNFMRSVVRLITRLRQQQQLNGIKKYQLYVKIMELRIQLMGIFVVHYNAERYKDFEQATLYNVESRENKVYKVTSKQQEHNCNHCLQQKPMSTALTFSQKSKFGTDSKVQLDKQKPLNLQQKQKQIVLSYSKKLYTANTHFNTLRFEFLQLIQLLILYSLNVGNFLYSLSLVKYSLVLSKTILASCLCLIVKSCNEVCIKCTRFHHHVLLNYMALI